MLDCHGHSLCIQVYSCESIPLPFVVSAARLLLQDIWTIMSRSFMASLVTPSNQAMPIVRQCTLVYRTPTAIPFDQSDCRYSEAQVIALMDDLDLDGCDIECRGITDVADCDYDDSFACTCLATFCVGAHASYVSTCSRSVRQNPECYCGCAPV